MNTFRMEKINGLQSAIAAMSEFEIRPGNTVTLTQLTDLTRVERVRARMAAAGFVKPSYTAMVVKAATLALKAYPMANRRLVSSPWPWGGRRVQVFEHLDVAVACERELPEAPMVAYVDVIRQAAELSLEELTGRLRALGSATLETSVQWRKFHAFATRLPNWLIRPLARIPVLSARLWSEYRGGALLISSPGKYGADQVLATWPWPLGLSFGMVKHRPFSVGRDIVSRSSFHLTLNFDRRIMAGAQGSRFFKRMVDSLEDAEVQLAAYLPSFQARHEPPPVEPAEVEQKECALAGKVGALGQQRVFVE